jgi:hypothetical protein
MIEDHQKEKSWYNGSPYALAESVFDEYSIEGCEPLITNN